MESILSGNLLEVQRSRATISLFLASTRHRKEPIFSDLTTKLPYWQHCLQILNINFLYFISIKYFDLDAFLRN